MRFLPCRVHHEDSLPFHERFSSDFSRLVKCITVNSFTLDHLTNLNKKITVPETMRTVIDDLEAMRETVTNFRILPTGCEL